MSATLAEGSPRSLRDAVVAEAEIYSGIFSRLLDGVCSGESPATIHLGQPFFEWLRTEPEMLALYARRMGNFGNAMETPPVFEGGDFFQSVPPGDAYVLSRIRHDWNEVDATRILRCVVAVAKPGARVVVFEQVVRPGVSWLEAAADLLMLAVTPGGRERTESEFRALQRRRSALRPDKRVQFRSLCPGRDRLASVLDVIEHLM